MATASEELIARIKRLLDRLAASRRLDNDAQEVIADKVAAEARKLPREGVLEALDKAVGSSKRRRQEAVYILSELTDVPQVVERVGEWLKDPDPQWRSWLIQTVRDRGLKHYAPLFNDIIEHDPDWLCRDMAIHAAGTLRQAVNLPVLLRLAGRNDQALIGRLVWALKDYATEECRPHLQRWFEDENQEKVTRVIAAWGLGKLGNKNATKYLVQMLDDPDLQGPTFYSPGVSMRAAQALCDIFNWPFEWHKAYVAKTVARVKERERGPH